MSNAICQHDFVSKSKKGVWCYECKEYLSTEEKESRSYYSDEKLDELNKSLSDNCGWKPNTENLVPNRFKLMANHIGLKHT